jgi:hypothetical protein
MAAWILAALEAAEKPAFWRVSVLAAALEGVRPPITPLWFQLRDSLRITK